jgi:chitinase
MLVFIFAGPQRAAPPPRSAQTPTNTRAKHLWVGAYVPGWNQERLASKGDHRLDAITHFLHFAAYFRPEDGDLDLRTNGLTPSKMRALVSDAHRAGKQALLVVGGEGAASGLRIATGPSRLQDTVRSIRSLVDRYGYDGIDVDWEPLPPADTELYSTFVESLRSELDQAALARQRSRLLLTTAIEVNLNNREYMTSLVRTLRRFDEKFDQINLMTYAMANPSGLPFVWHNSALYSGSTSPDDGFRAPSADGAIREFFGAGFRASKLGIGINLCGYLWQGQGLEDITALGKRWKVPPKVVELSYGEVIKRYSAGHPTLWDDEAEVPYISMSQTNQLISYEDSRGIEAKLGYVRQNGLGGVIIWEIGRDNRDEKAKRELLRAINDGAFSSGSLESSEIALP